MKKLLSALALVAVLGVTGCSESHEGVYKFDSIAITIGEETKTYTCSAEDKTENPMLSEMCDYIVSMQFELKEYKAVISMIDEEGNVVEGASEESSYKIEDGKFMVKEDGENEEFYEVGTYEKGKIVMSSFGDGVAVTYKKK